MPDLVTSLVQAGIILSAGVLLHRRLLVIAVAILVAAGGVWLDWPAVTTRQPVEHAIASAGVVVGLLLGWLAVLAREGRQSSTRRQREMLSSKLVSLGPSRGRRLAWVAVGLLLVGAAGGAWVIYAGGDRTLEQVRAEAARIIAPAGSAATAPGGQNAAVRPAQADAAPGAAAGRPSTTRTSTTETAHAKPAAPAERPRGDLRHCLERGSAGDVVRCAEQGN
jgi:hypothetical protein